MLQIVVGTRKYQGEVYTYVMEIPAYDGEKGCLGLEESPKIMCITPENWCGYTDTYLYDNIRKCGHFLHRHHPAWIARKIAETCERLYNRYIGKFVYPGCTNQYGFYDTSILEKLGYIKSDWNRYEKFVGDAVL